MGKRASKRAYRAPKRRGRSKIGSIAVKRQLLRQLRLRHLLLNPDGRVAIDRLTAAFHMSRANLAETVGVAKATLQRSARADAPKTQTRLREMLEIVNRVSGWAGGQMQAMAWYRSEPIPAFGGRTAESLVKDGKAAAVRDYLDDVALGGFA